MVPTTTMIDGAILVIRAYNTAEFNTPAFDCKICITLQMYSRVTIL